jgi:hypothetical protein
LAYLAAFGLVAAVLVTLLPVLLPTPTVASNSIGVSPSGDLDLGRT